jgi:hypothetical protein
LVAFAERDSAAPMAVCAEAAAAAGSVDTGPRTGVTPWPRGLERRRPPPGSTYVRRVPAALDGRVVVARRGAREAALLETMNELDTLASA